MMRWRDGVSNHRRLHCLLKCWFRRRSKKYQSSASLAIVRGIHRWPVKSPHKRPVTRKNSPVRHYVRLCALLSKSLSERFRSITPFQIHIWLWHDAYNLEGHRRSAILFSMSSVQFLGHTGLNIVNLFSILEFNATRPVAAIKSLSFVLSLIEIS